MTAKEKIFLNTIDELKERLNKLTEYDILKSSGLIRQLLIDGNSLVNQINEEYKIKILFRVQKRFEFPEPEALPDGTIPKVIYGMNFILPEEASSNVEMVNIKDFLKYILLTNGEEEFSVLDVVKICANKYGGIHIENVKNPREKSIDTLHNHFKFNDSSSILQNMHSIALICFNSLQPLVDAIKQKHPTQK